MTLSLSAARRVGDGRGAGLRAGGEGRIPENIPDPVPDPVLILGRAPGADFLMGDRRTGGWDSTCGAVVAGTPSKRATRVRIPGGAIFANFVKPTRGPVFCRGTTFPNGFSIRKSIRKSDPVL